MTIKLETFIKINDFKIFIIHSKYFSASDLLKSRGL